MSLMAALQGETDDLAKGVAAFRAGDLAAAIAHLQARVMQAPADFEARYWLSSAAGAAGQAEQAATILAEARAVHAHAQLVDGNVDIARLRADKAYAAQVGRNCYASKLMAAASD